MGWPSCGVPRRGPVYARTQQAHAADLPGYSGAARKLTRKRQGQAQRQARLCGLRDRAANRVAPEPVPTAEHAPATLARVREALAAAGGAGVR